MTTSKWSYLAANVGDSPAAQKVICVDFRLIVSCRNVPGADEVSKLGLWGNYSIPKDNPYTEDSELQPEIWTYGMRNPWRCSFDAERPDYFMCGDVGQVNHALDI